MVPQSRKAQIWSLTLLSFDVRIAGTLSVGLEGRGYVRVAFSTCVRQSEKLAVCVSASMSSVCVSLSQIASHRKRASVLLLSSPRSRERARRALGKDADTRVMEG